MLEGHDIVCISSIDWDFIWQGHQQIMATLAERGNGVLFIENTGVRRPRLADLGRLRHRLSNWLKSTKGFRKERENLYVFSPMILPFPYSRLARLVNRLILMRAIRRWMRATGFSRPLVWTFLPTALALDLLLELDPELSVYYCIDDFASSSVQARKIREAEERTFRAVDLVFVTSEKLRARAAGFNERVHLFPFGVDYAKFETARKTDGPEPHDLSGLPRPIIGYVGGIHQWVDQRLLAEAARRLPEASFVLVGPVQTDVTAMADCSNVRLLGGRAHRDVPRYMKAFDVAIIPYRLSDYTAHVYPTKLNEYLAMGLPVVATDLAEIRRFNADHGSIVAIASDSQGFADSIRAALPKASPEETARRIDVARENSWDSRIARMSDLIEARLAARRQSEGNWEETLRALYRRTRRRVIGAVATVGAVYLLLFYTPLAWFAAAPLDASAPPVPADAIVVLGSGVGESGRGDQSYEERVQRAVDLYRAGRAPRIVFSSGWGWTFMEAEVMRAL
ncbi:MAG: glycosyltransferase, partial [Candidatus Rokubacteria bacterium]|nr:glycosyltransferase [Candidatus Rokubacteria bacterium]